ncbi:MAG: M28 family peptidase [candidate division NC10 bacterium]|nr:M28 family peptidase [candidate division NC10 bacterium]
MRLSRDEQALARQVTAETIEEYTLHITRNVRLSGSPEEREAFRYIGRTLKGWGFEIEEHRHDCWTSWPGAALLEILNSQTFGIPCITHAMAASTPPEGVVLELVDVGRGDPATLATLPVQGRAALSDGLAMPAKMFRIEGAGAAAQINICGKLPHEMIASIVWGSPTPKTAKLLPRTPIVSVDAAGGAALREALGRGPVRVRIRAAVDTKWRSLPLLIAHLRAPKSSGDFLLVSGHVDSWYYGAMDNGTGNATQLEIGRIMAGRRKRMRRDLRLAFWSGHSHARYGGSAWYADTFWQELHEHCVLNLNVDCLGAKGATVLTEAFVMAEAQPLASDILEKITGQRLSGVRPKRAGDQSFWGHGIPSAFMTLSEQPPDTSISAQGWAQLMGGQPRTGGLGWFWHTPEDTLDKLDPDFLVRDAQVYTLVAQRLLEDEILPLDYRAVVSEAEAILGRYLKEAKGRFDVGPALDLLGRLDKRLGALARRLRREPLSAAATDLVNDCLMTLGRELIPIGYCRADRFEHDPTLAVPPFPTLEPMRRLGALAPKSDEARQLRVGLVRAQNKVCFHLHQAVSMVEATLAVLPTLSRKK